MLTNARKMLVAYTAVAACLHVALKRGRSPISREAIVPVDGGIYRLPARLIEVTKRTVALLLCGRLRLP